MDSNTILTDVKNLLGITGTYLDVTLSGYIEEVSGFLLDCGIASDDIPSGLVARGVLDLWNYGSGQGRFSTYFRQRATQLMLLEEDNNV